MIFQSVNINGIDMLTAYKMAIKDRHSVQPPVPKTYYESVPGADGTLDLTEANSGHVVYDRRKITIHFGCGYEVNKWPSVFSEILRNFHGKVGKLIFDDDPMYYYIGRMEVSSYKRVSALGTFAITVNADPYKYELTAGDEEWFWDPLDLKNGIIREYGNLLVAGEYQLIIDGTERWVVPEIVVSADMLVVFEGVEYPLKTGTNKIYAIAIREGRNTLTFKGNGTVTVKYRGGIL